MSLDQKTADFNMKMSDMVISMEHSISDVEKHFSLWRDESRSRLRVAFSQSHLLVLKCFEFIEMANPWCRGIMDAKREKYRCMTNVEGCSEPCVCHLLQSYNRSTFHRLSLWSKCLFCSNLNPSQLPSYCNKLYYVGIGFSRDIL